MGSIPTIPINNLQGSDRRVAAALSAISAPRFMKKPDLNFDSLPRPALTVTTLDICLKCAFDFFTKQLGLAARTAYSELKKHVPEEADFTGAATSRPHFFCEKGQTRCPYCNGSSRWFAQFRATRIEAHPSFEKERKKLWTALKKDSDNFAIWHSDLTGMQIFSEWLERLKRGLDFQDDGWMIYVALECVKRFAPSFGLEEALESQVRRVQSSRQIEDDWSYEKGRLYVSPALYGDILLVQHLLSRSHQHGGRTFKGRLTLQELMGLLRRMGYFEARGIEPDGPYEAFEQSIAAMVAKGPDAVYYAVDRSDYLKRLKTIYEKKREKK
ncbi:MAG: hypothetical protein L0229_28295 [Blastocatellia bacterium]|nr:hypothetical protein [Blastocatellia bacterium]